MKNNRGIQALLVVAILFLASCRRDASAPVPLPAPVQNPASLVLTNGYIYTADQDHSTAQAMAVRDDKIAYVGDDAGAQAYIGPLTKVIDLDGKFVMPGMIDTHAHATTTVTAIFGLTLNDAASLDQYQQAIQDYLILHPGLDGLQGGGWSIPLFDAQGPTAAMLDQVVPDIPALLISQDGHNGWANTRALQLAGITKDTPDPTGGIIERGPDGSPSGTLRESAVHLVSKVMPSFSSAEYMASLAFFQHYANSFGLTTVFIPARPGGDPHGLQALHDFDATGLMTLRYPTAYYIDPQAGLGVVDELQARQKTEAGGMFTITSAKIFLDGTVEAGTAYLEEPYLNTSERGLLLWEAQKFNQMVAALDGAGIQIHVHAIGDGAVRVGLDGFEYARQQNGVRDARHMLAHLQLVRPVDVQRLADLRITAVMQPYWFVADTNYKRDIELLGQERASSQFLMKTFFDRGVLVTSSSDFPVTPLPQPALAIEIGVTRTAPAGVDFTVDPDYATAMHPSEQVTVQQMLDSFTINAARALFMEDKIGSLEVSKQADFVILSRNPLQIDPKQIHTIDVLFTYLDGREVYSDDLGF